MRGIIDNSSRNDDVAEFSSQNTTTGEERPSITRNGEPTLPESRSEADLFPYARKIYRRARTTRRDPRSIL